MRKMLAAYADNLTTDAALRRVFGRLAGGIRARLPGLCEATDGGLAAR